MITMLRIEEPRAAAKGGFALWALGFRPFYLLGAAYAAIAVLLWGLQYTELLGSEVIRGGAAHAHEMIFGFAVAIVAGFLFTAVRNWTQQPTPTGGWLMAIVALWIAGRAMAWTPYEEASRWVNAAFPLAIAIGIGIPLVKSTNRRTLFFLALLAGLAATQWTEPRLALDLILFIIVVIAGRVVPMFTNNGVPGAGAVRNAWVERAVVATTLAVIVLDVFEGPEAIAIPVIAAAFAANLVRWLLWKPWRTLRTPLVWILHAAYGWLVVHFALRLGVELGVVMVPYATHALTVGAIGGMIMGMITRTARGHTGRRLVAGRAEVACYLLVQCAVVTRVVVPMLVPSLYMPAVGTAAMFWFAAFATYVVAYFPVLTRSRVDGLPG